MNRRSGLHGLWRVGVALCTDMTTMWGRGERCKWTTRLMQRACVAANHVARVCRSPCIHVSASSRFVGSSSRWVARQLLWLVSDPTRLVQLRIRSHDAPHLIEPSCVFRRHSVVKRVTRHKLYHIPRDHEMCAVEARLRTGHWQLTPAEQEPLCPPPDRKRGQEGRRRAEKGYLP